MEAVYTSSHVVLDFLLDREPFSLEAAKCFSRVEAGESISLLLSLFEIATVDKTDLEGALNLPFKDFEDAVVHEAARLVNADVIVTAIQSTSNTRVFQFGSQGNLERANLSVGRFSRRCPRQNYDAWADFGKSHDETMGAGIPKVGWNRDQKPKTEAIPVVSSGETSGTFGHITGRRTTSCKHPGSSVRELQI